jgi:hypothetical protein
MTCRGGRADNRSLRFQAPSLDKRTLQNFYYQRIVANEYGLIDTARALVSGDKGLSALAFPLRVVSPPARKRWFVRRDRTVSKGHPRAVEYSPTLETRDQGQSSL